MVGLALERRLEVVHRLQFPPVRAFEPGQLPQGGRGPLASPGCAREVVVGVARAAQVPVGESQVVTGLGVRWVQVVVAQAVVRAAQERLGVLESSLAQSADSQLGGRLGMCRVAPQRLLEVGLGGTRGVPILLEVARDQAKLAHRPDVFR